MRRVRVCVRALPPTDSVPSSGVRWLLITDSSQWAACYSVPDRGVFRTMPVVAVSLTRGFSDFVEGLRI